MNIRFLSLLAMSTLTLSACFMTQSSVPAPATQDEVQDGQVMQKDEANDVMVKVEGEADVMVKNDEAKQNEGMMKKDGGEPGDVMMKQDDDAMMKKEPEQAMLKEQVYTAFTAAALTDGLPKVLFFHAAWCPQCVKQDKVLKTWYPTEDLAYSVYQIDYDTSAELKQRYGVVQQHTYVKVDGQGNKISAVSFPSDDELKALLLTK